MALRDSDKEWEQIGRRDPYYGVLSLDKFRTAQLDNDSLEEFFISGRDHIDFVLETIRTSVPRVLPLQGARAVVSAAAQFR